MLTFLLAGNGAAQEWEFRVCADPASLPFSNRQEEGFENRIAQLLADEMGAQLTYDWSPQTDDMITFRLRAGECDAIIGVPDGTYDILTSLAYYRSPYVFVYREDAPFEIESLDDPVLGELRIAVQNVGIPPHDALLYRGLGDNVVSEYLEGAPRVGTGRSRAVVDAVANGEVDVALVWGPVAGYFASESEQDLVVQPVTPQFEPPFRTHSFPMTIGMRPGDQALRDRLDVALANRWDDINAILEEYGVPTEPLPQPQVSPPPEGVVRVGFVSPTVTGASAIPESFWDLAGDAAVNGALLAEGDLLSHAADSLFEIDVIFASTPTAEAARRAAQRLVHADDVFALVGGIGDGQAEELQQVATDADLLFINVGDPRLERECRPQVFHVESSYRAYLDAQLQWFGAQGNDDWFIVHEEGDYGAPLLDSATRALAGREDLRLVGEEAVTREQPSYFEVAGAIRSAGADAVLLLIHPRDQIAFMAQAGSAGLDAVIAPFPDPVTQTREYLASTSYQAGPAAHGERIVLWETTLQDGFAGDLNGRYMGRFGEPMDPPAWAAYAGITILHEAVNSAGDTGVEAVASYLQSPDVAFALGKGTALRFGPGSHQLQQPLFVIATNPEAQWRLQLANQLAVAELVDSVPSQAELRSESAAPALPGSDLVCSQPAAGGDLSPAHGETVPLPLGLTGGTNAQREGIGGTE